MRFGARPLLILRVAFDASGASTYVPRCRAVAVLYAAVRSQHGPDLYTRWRVAGLALALDAHEVFSPGGPGLRPCLAGEICFQLSCSEALCELYVRFNLRDFN